MSFVVYDIYGQVVLVHTFNLSTLEAEAQYVVKLSKKGNNMKVLPQKMV